MSQNENCPRCGIINFGILRDGTSRRVCSCGATWSPPPKNAERLRGILEMGIQSGLASAGITASSAQIQTIREKVVFALCLNPKYVVMPPAESVYVPSTDHE